MKVTYVGPFVEGVQIAMTGQICEPGESIDVDDDLGVRLCDQPDNWQPADSASQKFLSDFCAYVAPAPEAAPEQPTVEPELSEV